MALRSQQNDLREIPGTSRDLSELCLYCCTYSALAGYAGVTLASKVTDDCGRTTDALKARHESRRAKLDSIHPSEDTVSATHTSL